MSNLKRPIAYLVDSDIDEQGNLKNNEIPKNTPVMLMVHSNWCGHCTAAKPAYQEFANKNKGKVFCTTIQADGKEAGEKELAQRLNKILPGFRGFPHYAVFYNGKLVKTHEGGRSVQDLENCVKNLQL